ncbi:hypothetical protein RND81_04G235400 [Saponaria officinalis]|uniref:Cysteine proteinase inhibitor n=1 Tax=Saponaria officinalis TaxID=3572 RepID=A0AAW1LHG6_SAPOF
MHMTGSITEITGSTNSLEIDNLAKFAIDEHNKKENAMLELKKVVKVKEQVVAGTMYYITMETTTSGNDNDIKYYEAKIWVKPWMSFKQLEEFKFLGNSIEDASV